MITNQELKNIANYYGKLASWAVWDPSNPKDTSFIEKSNTKLHTKVVIVGLNISQELSTNWLNYHTEGHDRKLRYAFNESPYRGAYMTDIIKKVEVDSKKIHREIKFGKIPIYDHINNFRKEMKFVGADQDSLFILLGKVTSDIFHKELDDEFPNNVSCYHCSYYGISEAAWVENTWNKLRKYTSSSNKSANIFKESEAMQEQLKLLKQKQ